MPRKHKDTRPITDSIMLNKFLNKLRSEGSMGEKKLCHLSNWKSDLFKS